MMSNNTITNKINIDLFRENEAQGLITCRKHPTHDLLIWNYTQHCQFERAWNEVTMQARGLITTPDGTIKARPFRKFKNIEEHEGPIPLEPFKVTEKLDGSLAIMYFIDNKPYMATRGSFTSKQAINANKILYNKYGGILGLFKPRYTYLFECLYPQNRIVVNYGDTEDLVLLSVIDTETGEEQDIHDPDFIKLCNGLFPIVKRHDGIKDINELKKLEEPNKEGFVIRFENGLRLKAKFSDYIRIHRIVFGTNARTVWEYLKEGRPLSVLLDCVPDDFTAWVKSVSKDLSDRYRTIHNKTQEIYKQITSQASIATPISIGDSLTVSQVETLSRAMKKHIQEQFAQYPDIEHFLLLLYSEKGKKQKQRLHDAIWDSLYPEASRPFRIEEEAQG